MTQMHLSFRGDNIISHQASSPFNVVWWLADSTVTSYLEDELESFGVGGHKDVLLLCDAQ